MNKLTEKECANMSEAHFMSLPSQSNIYGLTKLPMCGGANKVLVTSLRGQVFSMEYLYNSEGELSSHTKEVEFTYIPNAAEIISMDAFRKFDDKNEFVVGITLIKNQDSKQSRYLNIYSNWEPGANLSVEGLGQYCLTLELNFIPYHLYHTNIYQPDRTDTVFLLSGSDKHIHLFIDLCNNHNFAESTITEKFPEFTEFPSIVRWIDIVYVNDRKTRLSAVGCEDGYIEVAVVDVESCNVVNKYNIYHDCPISCVLWFQKSNQPTENLEPLGTVEKIAGLMKSSKPSTPKDDGRTYHLAISSTIELAVVYNNVMEMGFEDQVILPDSDIYDCVNCCHIADIDMDGKNEIILGTYGQMLMVYKEVESGEPGYEPGSYKLLWQRKFSNPILTCMSMDITGDGMEELVVMSTRGVHILQHDLQAVQKLLAHRLELLVKLKQKHLDKKEKPDDEGAAAAASS